MNKETVKQTNGYHCTHSTRSIVSLHNVQPLRNESIGQPTFLDFVPEIIDSKLGLLSWLLCFIDPDSGVFLLVVLYILVVYAWP